MILCIGLKKVTGNVKYLINFSEPLCMLLVLHCIALHRIALYCIALHCIGLYCILLSFNFDKV